jgi:hypothetical protein
MLGDSLTVFLNLHEKHANYRIIGHRMRAATPGMLLNWAYYYDSWPQQQKDPNLWRQLYLQPDRTNFAQAHFFGQEHQLLAKFPGSRAIRVLAQDPINIDVYWHWLNVKLLSRLMYPAWYQRYTQFARLRDRGTQAVLAGLCEQKMLRVGHYWSAWYVDRQGMDLNLISDPWQYWLTRPIVKHFHPNLTTMTQQNRLHDSASTIPVYIDRLWPLTQDQPNLDYYREICDTLELIPNPVLLQNWWQQWRPAQPPVQSGSCDISWVVHK